MFRSIAILVAVAVVLLLAAPSSAIVVRHDKDERLYRELGERYPAAVSILPDGTGVIVGDVWVLTAAHVARGVGAREPRVDVGGKQFDVERIFLHPDWTRGPHDIALLRLARPVEEIEPARLYDGKDEVGMEVTFVGRGDFGTGLTGPTEMDRVLRGATNVVESADDDWLMFRFDEPGEGTELEGVSGPGDSGGPAFVELDGALYTIGVSVFADGDDGPGRYGVMEGYTRVSTHRSWIGDVMAGKLEMSGFTPGEDNRRQARRGAGAADGGFGITVGPLPDTPAGALVKRYIEAYNTNEWESMLAFMKEHYTTEYLDETSLEEREQRYRRIRDEHLGAIELRGVVAEEESGIRVLFDSERGKMAEFRFELSSEDPPRIGGLRVALVNVATD